jgi:hypothetical protein
MATREFRGVTHLNPDDDEYVGLEILELWGRDEFPGIAKHPLIIVDAGTRLTHDQIKQWLANGYVPVGVGGKLNPFDEHGRGDGISAATMAAEHYGITEDEALKPILAYSLCADDKAQDLPFNIATMVKTLHAAGMPQEEVRAMHRRWFQSLYLYFGGRLIFSDAPRSTFQQMAIAWLITAYGTSEQRALVFGTFADAMEVLAIPAADVDELREIAAYADRDLSRSGVYDFEFAGLVRIMQFTNASDADILQDVAVVLSAKVKTQRDFMAAVKYFNENAAYIDDDQRVVLVRSDNAQMQKAARRMNPRLIITVQKRSDGHWHIFSDQKRDLRPILSRLRAWEFRKSGGTGAINWTDMESAGTHEDIPAWYGFEKYGIVIHIFNGSLKTRKTPKTRLTEREIVLCVRRGLPHIHRARGIKRDRVFPYGGFKNPLRLSDGSSSTAKA